MSRSVAYRLFAVVAVLVGLATIVWGVRAVIEVNKIAPPPEGAAALSTATTEAGPAPVDPDTGLRHGFTQFPTVAVLGDSFATGYGTDRGRGWVEQLATDMCWSVRAKSAEVETGYTSAGGSSRTSIFADRVDSVAVADVDVVLVQGGVYDFPAPTELIYKNALDVFQLLKTELPETTKILALGPVASPAVKREDLDRIGTTIANAAKDAGVTYIDPVSENWLPDGAYFLSGNHIAPNDRGHTEFANRLAADLRTLGVPAGCQ